MKIRTSKYDIFVEAVCLLCLIGVIVYLFATWEQIPDKIPGHYNVLGEVDKYNSKRSIIALPVTAWILYIGLTVVGFFPQIWNTGVHVTEENKDRVYRVLKNMLGTFKFLLVGVFSWLTINIAMARPLHVVFLPSFVFIIFGMLIYFIIRLIQVK